MTTTKIKSALVSMVQEAGTLLLSYFGRITRVRSKENLNSVVCDADLAADDCIVRRIRSWFPHDGIIAEESGCRLGSSDYTWVIDPLDGTSNFVAGLPWFGVQIAVLRQGVPFAAAMFLPTENKLYLAQAGQGIRRNGKKLKPLSEINLQNTLCAFGFDATADEPRSRRNVELLRRVSRGVRNIRATNSLVDFCYTLEGRFGGCVNLNTKIWDIAPAALMFPEVGGKLTDLEGRKILFDLCAKTFGRRYGVVGASHHLHPQLLALV